MVVLSCFHIAQMAVPFFNIAIYGSGNIHQI